MKKYFFRITQLAVATAIFLIIQKCGDDSSVNADNQSISGTITFVQTTPAISGGYYAVSFFWADSSNPFGRTPVHSDSLPVNLNGGTTSIYYKTTGLPAGNFFVGCTFLRDTDKQLLGVLGTYGCDTSHSCANANHETIVQFPNYAGGGYTDFKSWTQVTQKIH